MYSEGGSQLELRVSQSRFEKPLECPLSSPLPALPPCTARSVSWAWPSHGLRLTVRSGAAVQRVRRRLEPPAGDTRTPARMVRFQLGVHPPGDEGAEVAAGVTVVDVLAACHVTGGSSPPTSCTHLATNSRRFRRIQFTS
jgi:hypothetical protein